MALYTEALKTDIDVPLPLRRLTTLLLKERGVKGAALELERLSHQTKRFQPEYKVALGALLLTAEGQDRSRAQTLFEEALQERPNMPDALFALAQLHEQRGEHNEAEQLYKKLTAKRGELSTRAKLLLATSYERQGKVQDAIAQYRELLSLSPRFAPAANNLAWLLANSTDGDLEEALKFALIAKEEMPKDSGITDTLAWVYHRRGSSRAALPLIEEAIELSRRDGGPPSGSSLTVRYFTSESA
jgi:tetratricopeptide (TPR) repeat protein